MRNPDTGRTSHGEEQSSREAGWAKQPLDNVVAHALRGLFGHDSLYMLMWALQLLVAAVFTPLITRVMGTAEFGSVTAATTVMQVLFVLAGLGLSTAIQRHYTRPEGHDQARRLLMLTILLAAAVTALADATGPLWSRPLGFESYGGAVRLAVFWAGASAVTNASLALLRSRDKLLAFSCVSLLQSVIAVAMGLLVAVLLRPTATMFVLVQLLLQCFAAALALVFSPPRPVRLGDRRIAGEALAYALPLVPAMLCTFVLSAVDRLIIQADLGLTEVARYQIAYNVGGMPMVLLGVLTIAWMPRIFALNATTERAAVLSASRDALYRLLTPVIAGLSIGSPLVLRLWAPSRYRPDELLWVTSIVIVSAIPYTAGLAARRALLADGRSGVIAVATGVAAIVNVVLNVVLVPLYGLIGAAAATFVALAVLHGLLLLPSGAVLRTRAGASRRLIPLAAAALVAMSAAALPTTDPYLVVRGILVVVTVAWFGWILAYLTRGGSLVRSRWR